MRKILLLSAALMAVLAGPALAQDRGDRGGDRGGGERGGGRPAAAAPAPAARGPAAPAARGPAAAPAPQAAPTNRAEAGRQSMQRDQAQRQQGQNRDRNTAQNNNNHRDDNNRPDANRGGNNGRPDMGRNDNRPGNNGARGRPNPSYSQYHRAFNAPHRYRGPSYHRPSGWYARRWTFGDFLPSLFWSSNYWINDFGSYGLMPPPPGAVWVRDGDDAILIDRYTGEVIQVEYDAFY